MAHVDADVKLLFFLRYLQEVGYTDTILDVRTQRVRSLLGLSGSEQNGSVENKNLQHLINGTERCKDPKRYTQLCF